MDQLTLSFLGFIAGALGATLWGYGWKIMEKPDLMFDKKYAITMLMSILLTVVTSPLVFLTTQIPLTAMGTFFILLTSYGMGFTANAMINRPVTFFANKVPPDEPPK